MSVCLCKLWSVTMQVSGCRWRTVHAFCVAVGFKHMFVETELMQPVVYSMCGCSLHIHGTAGSAWPTPACCMGQQAAAVLETSLQLAGGALYQCALIGCVCTRCGDNTHYGLASMPSCRTRTSRKVIAADSEHRCARLTIPVRLRLASASSLSSSPMKLTSKQCHCFGAIYKAVPHSISAVLATPLHLAGGVLFTIARPAVLPKAWRVNLLLLGVRACCCTLRSRIRCCT